ncbi:MAG: hypothetical protein JSR37_06965 [Verrucomicrobia bacterium]|nr:hypothetical protein [Verrucomicrobiota bacterium]MBS0636406.1 hypothetical protein [Verrucomicrobiota bacterium]
MDFTEIQRMCQRAANHSLSKTKLCVTSLGIVLCGLMVVFSQSLGLLSGAWVAFSLNFLPLFLSGGLLMGLGVMLIRSYHDEIKETDIGFGKLFMRSWHAALSSAYVFMPIVLIFLSVWALLGLFYLVSEVPMLGDFLASILSTGPFLLHLAALLLCLFSIYILFVVTPNFALKPFSEATVMTEESKRYLSHFFIRAVLLVVGLFPLLLSLVLLSIAATMTTHGFAGSTNHLQQVMQWLMIMLPYAVLLSPSVIFFFNMAAEAHVLVHKNPENV